MLVERMSVDCLLIPLKIRPFAGTSFDTCVDIDSLSYVTFRSQKDWLPGCETSAVTTGPVLRRVHTWFNVVWCLS